MGVKEFDYIIVGGGTAGCVLANRLSADPSCRVLMLEAGPEDKSIWLKIPAGLSRVFAPGDLNWGYFTEPEPHLNNRKVYWPRGKTLGGSSSINGMVYLRGHPEDYNGWAQLGNQGWAWDDVMPYFTKGEDNERGKGPHHGVGGELEVSDPFLDDLGGRLFIDSAAAIGTPKRDDLNDGVQHGVSRAQVTVRNHRRVSTATAFLHPIKNRSNLSVVCGALVHRVTMEGKQATGVCYERDGQTITVKASREVLICGGVVNSPHILLLSGIGPAAHLQEKGIDVVHDLPGVGENLQDHCYAYYNRRVKKEVSANHKVRGLGMYLEALKYFTLRQGYLNMGAVQATAFPIVGPGATRPDVEISFRPVSIGVNERGQTFVHDYPAVNASCSLLRPQARGRVTLSSADPRTYPKIFANYMDNEADLIVMREGLKWIREAFNAKPLADYALGEDEPGSDCQTDEDWEHYIRNSAQSVYHPVGTCKMGVDERAVVDPSLKVYGIEGLRVVDASVMPTITSCNTAAPTIMIAEKAADMINAS